MKRLTKVYSDGPAFWKEWGVIFLKGYIWECVGVVTKWVDGGTGWLKQRMTAWKRGLNVGQARRMLHDKWIGGGVLGDELVNLIRWDTCGLLWLYELTLCYFNMLRLLKPFCPFSLLLFLFLCIAKFLSPSCFSVSFWAQHRTPPLIYLIELDSWMRVQIINWLPIVREPEPLPTQ